MSSPVAFLTPDELRRRARSFLEEHVPDGAIPVPIESVVEFKLALDIVPTPSLLTGRGINGFLSSDQTTIYVDDHLFRNVPNRYRFTLAHEVGHLVLHGDLYHAFDSDEAWLKFRQNLARHDLSSAEYQANTFAGLILVPDATLAIYATKAFHQRAQPILAAHPGFDLSGEAF